MNTEQLTRDSNDEKKSTGAALYLIQLVSVNQYTSNKTYCKTRSTMQFGSTKDLERILVSRRTGIV